jgi:hypothetical protein
MSFYRLSVSRLILIRRPCAIVNVHNMRNAPCIQDSVTYQSYHITIREWSFVSIRLFVLFIHCNVLLFFLTHVIYDR